MAEKENPNYYAIIPANVRYDKSLTPNAKLLYGEITALCNDKGYCWASNEYFATLYGVSKGSISSWIAQLAKAKYISLQMIYREGSKEILNRYIRLFDDPIPENLNTPIPENLKDNTTSLNTTFNTTYDKDIQNKPRKKKAGVAYSQDFENFWNAYPKHEGKKAAYKAFMGSLSSGLTLEIIYERLKIYKARIDAQGTAYEFIRFPATFLNNIEDYADGFVPPPKQSYSKPASGITGIVRKCPVCQGVLKNGQYCKTCDKFFDDDGKELYQ